jgi:hypothetical protein
MRSAMVFALGLVLAACGGGSPQATTTAPRTVRGPADLITEAEINAGPGTRTRWKSRTCGPT